MVPAPWQTKLVFWLIAGIVSVCFVEVFTFSSPFAFFTPWGLLVVFPLYTLHLVVLAWIVLRRKRASLVPLYLAGMIFGVYEAYITKVLWAPTWGDWKWMAGGVAVVQSLILILYCHPILAFLLPLLISERFFTASNEIECALPRILRRLTSTASGRVAAILLALLCAAPIGVNAPQPLLAFAAPASGLAVVVAGWYGWRRFTGGRTYTMAELLPTGREALWPAGGLALLYALSTPLIRADALPRVWRPHLTIWAIYLILGALVWRTLQRAPSRLALSSIPEPRAVPPSTMLFLIATPLIAALLSVWKPLPIGLVLLTWLLGILAGIAVLAAALVIRQPR